MTSDNNKTEREIDEITGTETTGHEWDGIKELDTPMPRWWVWTFYATIVFSIGYVIYFPAIPLVTTSTAGISGITARGELGREMRRVKEARAEITKLVAEMPLDKIRQKDELNRFAIAGGKSLYKVYCSQCHGSGAQGAAGYPNLNDDDWLWGGSLKQLYQTIAYGVRSPHDDDTRTGEMPAFGRDEILDAADIDAVTEYVLKLSGKPFDAKQVSKGEQVYADNCASCHGEKGKGGRDFGAPNLADALSLYGATRPTIRAQVFNPRHGVMPAWLKRLGKAQVKQLTLYVHSLGGGEAEKAKE